MWQLAIIAALVILALWARPGGDASVARSVIEKWKPLVEQYRRFYPAVPLSWALAVIAWESKGDPNAVNPEKDRAGEYDDSVGLFQITDPVVVDFNRATGKQYNFSMLKTPWVNVEIGLWNLNRHLTRFGNIETAVRAHNGGAGGVNLAVTAQYLSNVKRYENTIRSLLR